MNTPIQGTALILLSWRCCRFRKILLLISFLQKCCCQVHDELIFEVPPQEIAGLIVILHECMESAVALDVPLKIDVNVGFNWYDMERV